MLCYAVWEGDPVRSFFTSHFPSFYFRVQSNLVTTNIDIANYLLQRNKYELSLVYSFYNEAFILY